MNHAEREHWNAVRRRVDRIRRDPAAPVGADRLYGLEGIVRRVSARVRAGQRAVPDDLEAISAIALAWAFDSEDGADTGLTEEDWR
jgi:hypothetical protein